MRTYTIHVCTHCGSSVLPFLQFANTMFASALFRRRQNAKRKRGGWRQRDADSTDEEVQDRPSFFALGLLQEWSDGIQSAAQLQTHMGRALRDGISDPLSQRLGAMGQGQDAHRGLLGILGELGLMDLISEIPGDSSWTHWIKPSTWLSHICKTYPRAFRVHFGCEEESLLQFWTGFMQSEERREWASQHPCLKDKTPHQLRHCVPCSLHQDAGPVAKNLSADCLSFCSLVGRGPERVTKFLVASEIKRAGNDKQIWECVLDDFRDLSRGIIRDKIGVEWSFIMLLIKADEEARVNEFGLASWSSAEPCPECRSNRSDKPYTDLSRQALWRPTEIKDLASFKARCRIGDHPLVRSEYFTRYCLWLDLMHLTDCKGISALVYGGVMSVVIHDRRFGDTQRARLIFSHITIVAKCYSFTPTCN